MHGSTPDLVITYGVVSNGDTHRGGYMPVLKYFGKLHGDQRGKGFDRDDALKIAEACARAEAAKYTGSFWVEIVESEKDMDA